MDLLGELEGYFQQRKQAAQNGLEDLFSCESSGIAARYASSFLQAERHRIDDTAKRDKTEKIQEGRSALARVKSLEDERNRRFRDSCTCVRQYTCWRCKDITRLYYNILSQEQVTVYEWPLPADNVCANVVVFFRHMPVMLSYMCDSWREYKLLQGQGSPTIGMSCIRGTQLTTL